MLITRFYRSGKLTTSRARYGVFPLSPAVRRLRFASLARRRERPARDDSRRAAERPANIARRSPGRLLMARTEKPVSREVGIISADCKSMILSVSSCSANIYERNVCSAIKLITSRINGRLNAFRADSTGESVAGYLSVFRIEVPREQRITCGRTFLGLSVAKFEEVSIFGRYESASSRIERC